RRRAIHGVQDLDRALPDQAGRAVDSLAAKTKIDEGPDRLFAGIGAVAGLERDDFVAAVAPAKLKALAFDVEEEHPFGAENAQIDLHRPALRQSGGAGQRAHGAAGEAHDRRVVVVDIRPRLAGESEHFARLEVDDAKEEAERVNELAPAETAGALRIGPGRGGRPEHRAFSLLHRLAREEVVERVRHLKDDVLDAPDTPGKAPRPGDPGLEVPAIGDDDFAPSLGGEPDESARVASFGGHRLLDQHVTAVAKRRARVLEMKDVRRGDDDAVHLDAREHLAVVLEAMSDSEGALNLGELARAKPVDRDDFAVRESLERRNMVGDRPPAGADDSDARWTTHKSCAVQVAAGQSRSERILASPCLIERQRRFVLHLFQGEARP